ncbi:MAG: chorismate synthase [Nitrososphaerales archaeon]
MTGNILGERFVIVTFGESHGKCVGVVIDGCPAGLPLSEIDIQNELDLRKPGVSLITTPRKEEDKVEILSGVFNGFTTGAPICMIIWNKDVDSKPYDLITKTPRPGREDYPAYVKYSGFNDYRGGGRFSGRVTASFVMAGAVAKKLLNYTLGLEIIAYTIEIGGIKAGKINLDEARRLRYTNEVRCPDLQVASQMRDKILEVQKIGDSVGGIIECVVNNVPIGLGEPIFSSLDSELSKALFSIPGVKGVEFGIGFNAARKLGSENNDPYKIVNGKIVTATNNAGGILGGISNGMPIVFRVAFKPTASIAKPQKTVNLETMEEIEITISGKHDPCIVPRAVPVVESVTSLVLADQALRSGFIPNVLTRKCNL